MTATLRRLRDLAAADLVEATPRERELIVGVNPRRPAPGLHLSVAVENLTSADDVATISRSDWLPPDHPQRPAHLSHLVQIPQSRAGSNPPASRTQR